MKKKYSATTRDKKAWISFTKQLENVHDKDEVFIRTKLLWQPLINMRISYTNINADLKNIFGAAENLNLGQGQPGKNLFHRSSN